MTVCSKKGYNTIITDEMTADSLHWEQQSAAADPVAGRIQRIRHDCALLGTGRAFLLYENPRRLLLVAGAFLHKKLKKRRNVYVQPEPKEMLLCVLPSGNQMDPAEEERKVDPGRAGRCLLCP
ncbi:hypothetical protein H9X81_10430 [Hydrogenoanaerobacterium saccharovorans]|uniref:Uncharacterized protein n=1 Tax=Hydrogenoanaerobacterium saccharovorans TaxID=474960 RepID=A0ABS2GRQ0_9FIRM|nr:hypothetical protein [Hydrogenoanaerobacterium saccharovorans]MBM6924099.1 hypothetical protein [Hydrogenoanaerobacterium saccharovorans]